jgi:hypothetical protein
MIINGGSRRAGGWWANHLENAEQNERVTLAEIVGFDAATIPDLFHEMEILARNSGSKAQNYFYQANVNPRDHEHLTPAQRHEAKELLLENLGLAGQPHFVVEHEKAGRVHFHVIALRIDLARGRAISDSLTAQIHERTSRELEIRFDLERGKSVLVADRDFERPERGAKKSEIFRGAETGIDPDTVKADARQARERADNGTAFRHALEASGDYVLACGDRRDFIIIDRAGDDHSLGRRLGMKAKDLRAYMADLDPASLPGVEQAKEIQRDRQVERAMTEARAAAKGRTDDIRPDGERSRYDALRATEHDVSRSHAAGGRYDDLRTAEPQPEIVRQFASAAAHVTEPAAPVWDRDAAARAADERIIDAAIKQAAPAPQEARQRPEPEAGREARAGAAEPAQAPPQPDAAHELTATAEATVDRAAHAGEGLLRRGFKIFASFIFWLADSIAPPPTPTRDQAERMARSAEEKQEARAQHEAKEAAHEFILREIERSRHSSDQMPTQTPTAAELYGPPKSRAQERDNERERDRGYEREL